MELEKRIRELHASGISKTKASEQLGMPMYQLEKRLSLMQLYWKPRVRGGNFVIDGVKDTIEGHSKRLGMTASTIRSRLIRQIPLTAPPAIGSVTQAEAQAFTELRQEGMAAWRAAQTVGRPYESLKNAAKRFCPDYLKVAANAPRIRRSPEEIQAEAQQAA